MTLRIKSIGPNDFGSYKCIAKNSLGETDSTIKLYSKSILVNDHSIALFKILQYQIHLCICLFHLRSFLSKTSQKNTSIHTFCFFADKFVSKLSFLIVKNLFEGNNFYLAFIFRNSEKYNQFD